MPRRTALDPHRQRDLAFGRELEMGTVGDPGERIERDLLTQLRHEVPQLLGSTEHAALVTNHGAEQVRHAADDR